MATVLYSPTTLYSSKGVREGGFTIKLWLVDYMITFPLPNNFKGTSQIINKCLTGGTTDYKEPIDYKIQLQIQDLIFTCTIILEKI